jgi:hypothetical protein
MRDQVKVTGEQGASSAEEQRFDDTEVERLRIDLTPDFD